MPLTQHSRFPSQNQDTASPLHNLKLYKNVFLNFSVTFDILQEYVLNPYTLLMTHTNDVDR